MKVYLGGSLPTVLFDSAATGERHVTSGCFGEGGAAPAKDVCGSAPWALRSGQSARPARYTPRAARPQPPLSRGSAPHPYIYSAAMPRRRCGAGMLSALLLSEAGASVCVSGSCGVPLGLGADMVADEAAMSGVALVQRLHQARRVRPPNGLNDTCADRPFTLQELRDEVVWETGDDGRERVLSLLGAEEPICLLPESRRMTPEAERAAGAALSASCYDCLQRADGVWESLRSWQPARHCDCEHDVLERALNTTRSGRNLRVLFLGDSHIRQIMLRAIAYLRNEHQAFDHFFECHSSFTWSADLQRDMLKTCTLEPYHKSGTVLTFFFYVAHDWNDINFEDIYKLAPDVVFHHIAWTVLDIPGIEEMQQRFGRLSADVGSSVYWLTEPRNASRNVMFNKALFNRSRLHGGATVVNFSKLYFDSPLPVNIEDSMHKMCGVTPELKYTSTLKDTSYFHIKGWKSELHRYDCEDFDDLYMSQILFALYYSDAASGGQRRSAPVTVPPDILAQPRLKSFKKIGSLPPGTVMTGSASDCTFPTSAAVAISALAVALHFAMWATATLRARAASADAPTAPGVASESSLAMDWRALDGVRVFLTLVIVASHASANTEWQAQYEPTPSGRAKAPAMATFWAWSGHPAMIVFFVVSGVLAQHSMRGEGCLETAAQQAKYYRKRALRLLPAYYLSVLYYLPAATGFAEDIRVVHCLVGRWLRMSGVLSQPSQLLFRSKG